MAGSLHPIADPHPKPTPHFNEKSPLFGIDPGNGYGSWLSDRIEGAIIDVWTDPTATIHTWSNRNVSWTPSSASGRTFNAGVGCRARRHPCRPRCRLHPGPGRSVTSMLATLNRPALSVATSLRASPSPRTTGSTAQRVRHVVSKLIRHQRTRVSDSRSWPSRTRSGSAFRSASGSNDALRRTARLRRQLPCC